MSNRVWKPQDLPERYHWLASYYVPALSTDTGQMSHAGDAIDLVATELGFRCETLCGRDGRAGTRDTLPPHVPLANAATLLKRIGVEPLLVSCSLCLGALENEAYPATRIE